MSDSAALYCFDEVRTHDRDRYLTTLFAPDNCRGDLTAIYAFNLEIGRIPFTVSEPMLAEIRLQWWRDAIAALYAGNPGDHPVIRALADTMLRQKLSRVFFENMIDSCVRDAKEAGFDTLDGLSRYTDSSGASLVLLAMEVLGVGDNELARRAALNVGTAWALLSLVRAQPILAAHGRLVLPMELVMKHQVQKDEILAGKTNENAALAFREILALAQKHLDLSRELMRDVPKVAHSPLLISTLADKYLKILAKAGGDPFAVTLELNPLWRVVALWSKNALGRY
jgi:phytoene synthase